MEAIGANWATIGVAIAEATGTAIGVVIGAVSDAKTGSETATEIGDAFDGVNGFGHEAEVDIVETVGVVVVWASTKTFLHGRVDFSGSIVFVGVANC